MTLFSAGATRTQLESTFNQLTVPETETLAGKFAGTLYGVEGIRLLPLILRHPIHRLLQTSISPWKGKMFEQSRGSNLVIDLTGRRQLGFYRIFKGQASDSSGQAIILDYDVPENPLLLWAIKGELREISSDQYLARMLYVSTKGRAATILYFTLERI